MGKLWSIIEDWRDAMEFPPSYRQIALKLDVSQSAFDTWKNPIELPARHNLLAIAELTSTPFERVVQAAIDDAGVFDEERAKAASVARRKGQSKGRALRKELGKVGEESQVDPNADDGGA